jgi:hypothetical protein
MARVELQDLETSANDKDKWGIRKLYPNASDEKHQEWYIDMDDPKQTPRLKNLKRSNLKKRDDGSLYVDGTDENGKGEVRLEAWSESGNKKWLNTEVTVYGYYMEDLSSKFKKGDYAFQLYSGGGHHSKKNKKSKCEGSCYKIGLFKDGNVAVRKEPQHPVYCENRGKDQATNSSVKGRWIGLKQVRYNFKEDNKVCVANEIWIDDSSDDDGELKLSNRWRMVANVKDTGGWGFSSEDHKKKEMKDWEGDCRRLDENSNHEHRRVEDIINMPGGTSEGNLAALRCDGVKLKFKYFSVREIRPPTPD